MKLSQRVACCLVSVFVFSISFNSVALDNSSQVAEQKSPKTKPETKKRALDCRKIRVTSSRIKKTICLSKQDWKRLEETSQELARRGF